ncbi:unnamed protein product [Chrysodeixis includens]|uniref:Uncharacterized protein n=1 Tax=Chrysodeixis includens TaxID=689277 RepID=A0A9N8KW81_CHRIL|nr:unnamed protein product [Chrysodeixis includens]
MRLSTKINDAQNNYSTRTKSRAQLVSDISAKVLPTSDVISISSFIRKIKSLKRQNYILNKKNTFCVVISHKKFSATVWLCILVFARDCTHLCKKMTFDRV